MASITNSWRFYRDVLGFGHTNGEPCDADGFAIIRRDGLGLQIVMAGLGPPAGQVTVWIQVGDAQAEYERVRRNAAIEWGPEVYWYGCREFAVLDPDGHRMIFSSPTNEPPTCQDGQPGA